MKYPIVIIAAFLLAYSSKKDSVINGIAFGADTLVVGDIAPPLKTIKWLKGDSIAELQKDKVYLIEMGFAACTDCRASIPHLSNIAGKYRGRLKVIGIHIWENNKNNPADLSYVSKVENYLASVGKKISYDVAVDKPEQTTADTWGGGAPKSFIVGRDNKILWIGHPDDLDPVLEKIMSNSFKPFETAEKQKAENNYYLEQYDSIWQYKKAGNYTAAIATIDNLISEFPSKQFLYYEKYRVLDGMDSANQKANGLVKWLLKTKPKGFNMMYKLSHAILNSKYPDYDLAIAMADWALHESTYNYASAFIIDAKAIAYYKKGDIQKASDLQKQAIGLLKPENAEMKEAIGSLNSRLSIYENLLHPAKPAAN